MHPNVELIENFTRPSLAATMPACSRCYDPAVDFADPVFTVQANVHTPCGTCSSAEARPSRSPSTRFKPTTQVEARTGKRSIIFRRPKRPVLNIIDAEFKFRNGKIYWHRDHFDFWKWSRQALGTSGMLLGWSPILHNRVRKTASANLDKFIVAHSEYR